MNFSRIRPTTVALAVASAVMLLVGTYTGNGGIRMAGAIVAVVTAILAINQMTGSDAGDEDRPR